jgi:hypothetical protein
MKMIFAAQSVCFLAGRRRRLGGCSAEATGGSAAPAMAGLLDTDQEGGLTWVEVPFRSVPTAT